MFDNIDIPQAKETCPFSYNMNSFEFSSIVGTKTNFFLGPIIMLCSLYFMI